MLVGHHNIRTLHHTSSQHQNHCSKWTESWMKGAAMFSNVTAQLAVGDSRQTWKTLSTHREWLSIGWSGLFKAIQRRNKVDLLYTEGCAREEWNRMESRWNTVESSLCAHVLFLANPWQGGHGNMSNAGESLGDSGGGWTQGLSPPLEQTTRPPSKHQS